MKILICSDFQIGSGSAYGTPAHPRLADQEASLEALAREPADLTLFLGDAFEHRRPTIDELLVFARWAYATPEALMLAGNHDQRGPGMPSSLDLFGERNHFVWAEPGYTTRQLPGERPVAIGFLPWTHPASAGDLSPEVRARLLEQVASDLEQRISEEEAGCFKVLALHWALGGQALPAGLPTDELGEPVLEPEALRAQGWDAIVAGHIHKAAPLLDPVTAEAYGASCGSPYICNFGEAGDPHGAWLLDTEQASYEFVSLPGRPFVTVEAEAEQALEIAGGAEALEGAVVRVRLRATEEEARSLDLAALRQALYAAGAHKVYSIEVEVEREARARANLSEDSEPLEALNAWLLAAEIEPREAERLRALTAAYLEED